MADYKCSKCGHTPKTAAAIEDMELKAEQTGNRYYEYRMNLCEMCSETPYDEWERIHPDGKVEPFPLYFK